MHPTAFASLRSARLRVMRELLATMTMKVEQFLSAIKALTIPCHDNGVTFTNTARVDHICARLRLSSYSVLDSPPLARIYRHAKFSASRPYLFILCHVDSIYDSYWCKQSSQELHGTLDNSACNAILLQLMLDGLLSTQTIVTFTGNEEDESLGVDQTIDSLQKHNLWDTLEIVVTLDLTEECYGSPCTLENLFAEEQHGPKSVMRFGMKRNLAKYLTQAVGTCPVIIDGDPDESWQYDEYDLNCFSMCLPCRLLGEDMHDTTGVAIDIQSIPQYASKLAQLVQVIENTIGQPSPSPYCSPAAGSESGEA